MFRGVDEIWTDAHHRSIALQHARHFAIVEPTPTLACEIGGIGAGFIGEHAVKANFALPRDDALFRAHERVDASRKAASAAKANRTAIERRFGACDHGGDADATKNLTELHRRDYFAAGRIDEHESV